MDLFIIRLERSLIRLRYLFVRQGEGSSPHSNNANNQLIEAVMNYLHDKNMPVLIEVFNHPHQTIRVLMAWDGQMHYLVLLPGRFDDATGEWIPRLGESIYIRATEIARFIVALQYVDFSNSHCHHGVASVQ